MLPVCTEVYMSEVVRVEKHPSVNRVGGALRGCSLPGVEAEAIISALTRAWHVRDSPRTLAIGGHDDYQYHHLLCQC